VASKRDHKVCHENQSIRGLFSFEFSFQNCFWNLFSTSGLSQICKIRNVWKLPIPFSRITLIPSSENIKNIILEEKIVQLIKNGHENFSGFVKTDSESAHQN
jgi:hypothetical protein